MKNVTLSILIVLLFAMSWFGPLFFDTESSHSIPLSEVAQNDAFLKIFYWVRFLLYLISANSVCAVGPLIQYKYWLSKRLFENKVAIRIKKVSSILYVTLILAMIFSSLVLLLKIAGLLTIDGIRVSDFSRYDIFGTLGIVLVCLYLFFDEQKSLIYFKTHEPSSIMGAYYLEKHSAYFRDGNIEKAYDALVKACEAAPSDVVPWAARAAFANEFLSLHEDAEVYLERATENLRKNPKVIDEEKAWYEFYLGRIMFTKGNVEDAISHIEKSLKLNYHDARANCLEQLREQSGRC